tara:strand:- start:6 stop:1100 length:1095 start_codon:yes stop_codon:yes gene_type:complete
MSKAAELANLIGNINAGGGGVNRNLIINGAMNVAQRGTSFSFTDSTYCLDRFVIGKSNSSGAATITQDSSVPDGFANSLKLDVTGDDTSLAVNHIDQILHKIEAQNLQQLAFGTSSAKNFTLSFYVKSNKTGNYSVNIGQQDNSYKQANLLYTINSANTWERKSLTFTGDTSGVINDDNGSGFEIAWILASGTTYTSGSNSASFSSYANANYAANHGVNIFDSTDNTWFLTGVQLEIGQNPTEFEHEPVERTLKKCERYYYLKGKGAATYLGNGGYTASSEVDLVINFPTTMRSAPSLEQVSGTNYYNAISPDGTDTLDDFVIHQTTIYSILIYNNSDASGSAGYYAALNIANASGYIAFKSEL